MNQTAQVACNFN